MAVKAKLSYLRISPRKVRLVANIVKKKKVEKAQLVLKFTPKKASYPLLKLLNSVAASAKNDFKMDPSNLYVSDIIVNEGPKYKRWRARSRGMASPIQKKTSHITIVLDEIIKGKKLKEEPEKEKKPEVKKIENKKDQPNYRPPREEIKPKQAKGIKRFFRRKSI